jgi:hypothetical protein
MFLFGKPFQPSLMFVGKDHYFRVEHLLGAPHGQALTLIIHLRLACKSCSKHSELLRKFVTYGRKKFHNIGPWCQFHQHFMSSFCTKILLPKNYKPKLYSLKSCAKNFGMTIDFTNILQAASSY